MMEEVKNCVHILRNRGVILYPTDTVWGLGCSATDELAVKRIFEIKKRPDAKTMIVLVSDIEQLQYYASVPPIARDLIEYAEKPLTIVYPEAKRLAPSLIATDGTIAIRVVKDRFCQMVINSLRKPLVSTSANISGEPFPACFDEISEEIKSNVDYIVPLRQEERKKNVPSRIIKLSMNGAIEIIR